MTDKKSATKFEPKLGKPRSPSARKQKSFLGKVSRAMNRAGSGKRKGVGQAGQSVWSGSRNGRGYVSGSLRASRSPQPGRRRVVVKARITRFKGGNISAAKAHLGYLQRDGVTREGERGEIYNELGEGIDGKSFLEQAQGDRHQFRMIVAPEDSAELVDLKPFTRDLMKQVEADLGTKLDWVAVDHFNTGHPHTHIVIRGKDDLGQDLIIARDYMSHGFRERARDLVTLELGPETEIELSQKLEAEMTADRFTRIDRSLLRETDNGVLSMHGQNAPNQPNFDQHWQSLKTGRLRKLETMGLAEEMKPGIWRIAERTETVLRDLGQRGDIMKSMQQVLKDTGMERGINELSTFQTDDSRAKVTGKIVAIGLSDEINNHHYVVVDGTDGKLHYADIGQLNETDPPSRGQLVTLRGRQQALEQAAHRHQQRAQLFIESHCALDQLATANGATWLDRKLLSKTPNRISNNGFGRQVREALRRRQQWLVQQGLMEEQGGGLIARRRMMATLTQRDIEVSGKAIEKQTGLQQVSPSEIGRAGTKITRSTRLASGRFAVMQNGKQFALVPWQQAMQMRKAKGMGISV